MRIVLTIMLLLVTAAALHAGEVRQIELTDGSVITGEVLSFVNDVYTVKTESLGTVSIKDSRIKAIHSPVASSSALSEASSANISSLTEKMLSNDDVMALIQELKDDPEFQKALDDPTIVNAVKSGDTATLMENPKFLKLLENSKVKEIQEKVAK